MPLDMNTQIKVSDFSDCLFTVDKDKLELL